MYITRKISEKILNLASQYPVLVLTGARQVGKSTLLKHLFPSYGSISLDLPSAAELAENNPEVFLQNHPGPLIIDEIQYAPKLFRHIKIKVDRDRHAMGQFILTGSQKFTLMKEISESLAGRAVIVELENLSLVELNHVAGLDLLAVLQRGLFPELWRVPTTDSQNFYRSYLATYLERDVRQILNVQSLRDFERFLRSCAARSAQLLNLSELARDVGIKSQTARDWLSVLEASNQITLLEPYFENIGKRIVKSPKIYINDPGMLCFLLALDSKALLSTPFIGLIWETFVFAELRKMAERSSSISNIYFYRDGQGKEVDFIFLSGGKINLLECKWTEDPDKRWITNLNEVGEHLKARTKVYELGKKILVCRIQNEVHRNEVVAVNIKDCISRFES